MAHENNTTMGNLPPPPTYAFDPDSLTTIQNLSNVHRSHRELKTVLDAGSTTASQTCQSNRVSLKSGMSYDQFLEGMLFFDEQILGSAIIYYTGVVFYPVMECGTQPASKDIMTKGRLYLTNHRIMLLSAEEYQGLTFAAISKISPGVYSLNGRCSDVLHYQCVPLGCIKSVELNASLGVTTSASIIGRKPCCCFAFCAWFGYDICLKSWFQNPFRTFNENQRILTIGATLPPWGHKYIIKIHVDVSIDLKSVKDFIADLQRFAPDLYPKISGSSRPMATGVNPGYAVAPSGTGPRPTNAGTDSRSAYATSGAEPGSANATGVDPGFGNATGMDLRSANVTGVGPGFANATGMDLRSAKVTPGADPGSANVTGAVLGFNNTTGTNSDPEIGAGKSVFSAPRSFGALRSILTSIPNLGNGETSNKHEHDKD